ncbi:MAG: FecR domain-containing protein [Emcibacter sp.]|nr:FecR domain-containing protein [Emcibacter sp.]
MNEQITDDKILDEATEWFVLMRAEDISPARAAGFADWISQSDLHQAAYREIGGLWDELPVMVSPAASPARDRASVTSLADHKIQKKSHKQIWSPGMIAASIAFLAISIMGYGFWGNNIWMDSHSTKIGALADVVLEDGSRLALNTNSEIRVDLQKDKRVVYLTRGEVFFEVAKDVDRPFFVETTGGLVRVLGTKFNIRQKEFHSDVTVLEGSVGVMDHGRMTDNYAAMPLDATLTSDQKFSLGNDAVDNKAIAVDSHAVLSWRDRKLIYNGESFADLVEDINRYYNVEIRIGDPALRDVEVVAILKIEDRATTLKALETTFNVKARTISKDLITLYPNK